MNVRMARLDWDRLRRERPLDNADPRVDPDGGLLWERTGESGTWVAGARYVRAGVIVRRRAPPEPTDPKAGSPARA